MKQISLTQGKTALVDSEDYDDLSRFKWHATKAATRTTEQWYAARRTNGTSELMHRRILGASKGQQVDHRDGDGLNNVRKNLRAATSQQNQQNRRPLRRFKGTWLDSDHHQKYGARIKVNGKSIWLGFYASEDLAAKAYDQKALELFGEFARLNFPADVVKA